VAQLRRFYPIEAKIYFFNQKISADETVAIGNRAKNGGVVAYAQLESFGHALLLHLSAKAREEIELA
jgi:hypothetical protein